MRSLSVRRGFAGRGARLELGDSRAYAGLSRFPFAHVALFLSLEAPTLLHHAAGLRFDDRFLSSQLRRIHNTYAIFTVYTLPSYSKSHAPICVSNTINKKLINILQELKHRL